MLNKQLSLAGDHTCVGCISCDEVATDQSGGKNECSYMYLNSSAEHFLIAMHVIYGSEFCVYGWQCFLTSGKICSGTDDS